MTSRKALIASIAALLLGAGCTGGQFGEEGGIGCLPVERTPIEPEDTTPLGFTARDSIDATPTTRVLALDWEGGGSTTLQLEIEFVGPDEYQDREWVSEGDAELALEAEDECRDILSLPVAVSLVSDDGALDEDLDLALEAYSPTESTLYAALDAAQGTLNPADFAPEGTEVVQTWIELELLDGVWTGVVSGVAEQSSGGGDDGVVSGMQFRIATIGPEH